MSRILDIRERLEFVSETFGLPIESITNDTHELYVLYRAAKDWRQAGYPYPKDNLHKPILNGRSLYYYLTNQPLELDAIDFIGSGLMMDANEPAKGSEDE